MLGCLAIGATGCGPSRRTPLGGGWVQEWRGPVLAEAGGHQFRLLRKRLLGYRLVDEFITRPRYQASGDCVVYEQMDADEIRVVCGDGIPHTLLANEHRLDVEGEFISQWEFEADGLRKKPEAELERTKCITSATLRAVARGGATVIEECAK